MRKYNPGGPTGPGNLVTPDKTQPVNPPMNPPVNSTVPSTPAAPVAPITNNATAQVPQSGTGNALLDAQNRYRAAGYSKMRAKKLAMQEVNPTLAGKQAAYAFKQQKKENRPRFGQVLQNVASAANTGLDLANKATPIVSAISNIGGRKQYGGAKKSRFESGGGVMSGKELRRAKSYQMEDGGSVRQMKRDTNLLGKAAKSYGKAASSYAAGNVKKGDRQMNRADRKSARVAKRMGRR